MPINLDEIEAKAKAATPGPWNHDGGMCEISAFIPSEGEECVLLETLAGFATEQDYAHIATVHPALILEWVAETRRLRESLQELIKLAAAATPTQLGGTPDLFWPKYEGIDWELDHENPWEQHETIVRAAIERAAKALKGDG